MKKSIIAIAAELVCLVALPMTDVSAVSNGSLRLANADIGIRSMTEKEVNTYLDSGDVKKICEKTITKNHSKYKLVRYSIPSMHYKTTASICSNLSFIHNPELGDTVVNFETYQSLNLSYVERMGVSEKAEAKVDVWGYEIGVFGSMETEMAIEIKYSEEVSMGSVITLDSSHPAGEYFLWFDYMTVNTITVKYLVYEEKEFFCEAEYNPNSPCPDANPRLSLKKPSYKFEEDAIC